jgi:hypothetical protein
LQEHRIINHERNRYDTICVAKNIQIDFTKVHGGIGNKSSKLQNYISFDHGAITGNCKKTAKFDMNKLHKHMRTTMSSFQDGIPLDATGPSLSSDSSNSGNGNGSGSGTYVESTPTYLLIRDEDCENSFHSTAGK